LVSQPQPRIVAITSSQCAGSRVERCGAQRYRDEAEYELGKLGRRPHRRTAPGALDVGEEEGDGAGRELGGHAEIMWQT
jgi:hypothetical protein